MVERIVIVGGGHAAGQVCATLRQKKFPGNVVMIGEEPYLPYQRPPLSKKFLAGKLPKERLLFKPESFYDDPQIEIHTGTRVTTIDRETRSVRCSDGADFNYDKLILATGARVRKLPIPGSDLPGVCYVRTIDDVLCIREQAGTAGRKLVIVGAGYIGLEVAAVSSQLGLEVTVVETEDRVMSRVVSPPVSEFYQREHVAHGVTLRLSTSVEGFGGDDRVRSVILPDGEHLPADLVVVGVGIAPNTGLADECGLDVADGIVVDDRCLTSDPDIYAVGDCTHHPNELLGRSVRLESVHNAVEQAKTAASNICGDEVHYAQVPWFWSDQYDLKLQIAGLSQGYDDVVIRGEPDSRTFSCAYLKDGALIAVDAINSPRDFMQSKALIAAHAVIDRASLEDADIALKDLAPAAP